MRITLLVFSQTGNTLRVAEAMADALEAAGHTVLLLRTPLFAPAETELPDADVLIVGSPVFFSRAPSVIREYVAALPGLDGLPAFVFVTSGGASGRALWDLRRALERRGAAVHGGAVFPGEVRYPAHSLRGRQEGLPGDAELERAARLARAVAETSGAARSGVETSGTHRVDADRPSGLAWSLRRTTRGLWGFYGLVALLFRPRVLRFLLRVPVVDPAVCNRCRWCVGACPVGAIALERSEERRMRPAKEGIAQPRPETDAGVCIRCYRCLDCPIGAYSLDWRRGVEPLIGALYHPRLVALVGDPEARV